MKLTTTLGKPPQHLFLWYLGLSLYLPPVGAEWHGKVRLLSDYVYRGYSKSRGDPVGQGQFDYQNQSGWFAGLGVSPVALSSVYYKGTAEFEARPYTGWRLPITTDWQMAVAATGYIYDGTVFAQTADYAEYSAALHYQDSISAKISVAPNAYQRHATTVNYELDYRRDIADTVQVSASLAYAQMGQLLGQDYFYWNAGLSWFVTSSLSLDLRYVDTQLGGNYWANYHYGWFQPSPMANQYLLSMSLGF